MSPFEAVNLLRYSGVSLALCTYKGVTYLNADNVVRTFSGNVAEEWDQKSKYIESVDGNDDRVPELFSLLIKKGDENVLDVGCGTGKFAKYAAEQYPHAQIMGIDESQAMIRLASRGNKNNRLAFSVADIVGFQQPRRFDVIVMKQVLHHIRNKIPALRASRKMLSDGGKLLVMVPNPRHQHDIIPYSSDDDPLGRISESDMSFFASESGLEIESVRHDNVTATFSNELNYFLHLRSIGSLQKIYCYQPVEETLGHFLNTFAKILSRGPEIQTTFGYSYYILKTGAPE